jgi:hypothetical protein
VKLIILLLALLGVPILMCGQGTITFNNRATAGFPSPVVAPIFGVDPACPTVEKHGNPAADWNGTNGPTPRPIGTQVYGGVPLTGTGFTAAIWGVNVNEPDGSLLDPNRQPLAITPFRVSTELRFQGFWVGSTVVVPGVPFGADRAKFIVRAWDNKGGTLRTWPQVLGDLTTPRGDSGIFTVNSSLGGDFSPTLTGLESFQLFLPGVLPPDCIPEPSTLALCGLVGALFFLRQKVWVQNEREIYEDNPAGSTSPRGCE